MASTHTIKQGDTLPVMDMILYKDEALTQPVDLTNASSVTLKVGDGAGGALLLNNAMTVVTAAEGRIRYQFTLADWDAVEPGEYSMEVEVTWSSGDISTYPKVGYATLDVEADLDPTSAQ